MLNISDVFCSIFLFCEQAFIVRQVSTMIDAIRKFIRKFNFKAASSIGLIISIWGLIICFSKFLRTNSCVFSEKSGEIRSVVKAKSVCNLFNVELCEYKHSLCFKQNALSDVISCGYSGFLSANLIEVIR